MKTKLLHRALPMTIVSLSALALMSLNPTSANAVKPGDGPVWEWPVAEGRQVTRPFDPPAHNWLPGHRGVDLSAPVGSFVSAPKDGVVRYAGTIVDRNVVSIDHGAITSTYEPVLPLVTAGESVTAGQVIGIIEGGHSPGPLHWGAKIDSDSYINPLRLLVGRVHLKEWE
ncbi:M23 family metallopeptidase [Schaalia vaccimaxillae]|uniref:M23 family metallopeptidase n=1 Tax=Schaalia vaccimaxillae TaxID=183916 RepID=UPI0013F44541|nr:M23 family metallopeptidase [Schaalia vaccimaxillae]